MLVYTAPSWIHRRPIVVMRNGLVDTSTCQHKMFPALHSTYFAVEFERVNAQRGPDNSGVVSLTDLSSSVIQSTLRQRSLLKIARCHIIYKFHLISCW
jgi:hypothetical protein